MGLASSAQISIPPIQFPNQDSASNNDGHFTVYRRQSLIVEHSKPWFSLFTPHMHSLGKAACQADNAFFLQIVPFCSEAECQLFLDMDLSRWAAQVYAESLDSRIHITTRIITALFFVDGACIASIQMSSTDTHENFLRLPRQYELRKGGYSRRSLHMPG